MNRWNIPDWLEREVIERDRCCVYCRVDFTAPSKNRRDSPSWEHIVNDASIVTRENIARCCVGCNASKGTNSFVEWLESSYCRTHGITRESVAPVVRSALDRHLQPSMATDGVINALIKQAKRLPSELYKSLTWDRGKELTDHRRFTLATDVKVYFCDPQSPWQRGSHENTNRLLRQYFPKGTDFSVHSQAHLNKVARRLNERPRKTLGFETPAERFSACVAATD